MKIIEFQPLPGENIVYRTSPLRKWYVVVWKILSGLVGIAFLTAVLYALLANSTENIFKSILPEWAASVLTLSIYLGLFPLAGIAWVAEDMACTLIGDFILTDRRLWVRGSPHLWSQSATPLDNIDSVKSRRDAIFIRFKSSNKFLVLMLSDGELFIKAYGQLTKTINGL